MTAIGIDFGTTNSSMARIRDGRGEVIRDAEGEEKTPSVVFYGAEDTLVGLPAVDVLANAQGDADLHARFVGSVKRNLLSPPRIALPGGRTVTPVEVAGSILAKLRRDAQASGDEIDRAVITYPAVFDAEQSMAIHQAAHDAGFEHVEVLEEPVAAAIAFEQDGGRVGHGVLAYDFGGGTFDVACVVREEREERFYLAMEPEGDPQCGGDDLDQILYAHFDSQARRELGRPIAGREDAVDPEFLRICRRHKERLSHSRHASFSTVLQGGDRFTSVIDRATFEELIAEQIERTIAITARMAERAREAGYPIDTVLLIGGSSQLPLVERRITEELGVTPQRWAHRDVAVALGAAYHAERLWGASRPSPPPAAPEPDGEIAELVTRGTALRELGRLEEAIATYDRVLAGDAGHAEAAIGRGDTYRRLHRLDDALADFDRVLAADPESPGALIGRARVQGERYRLDEGLRDGQRAVELMPDSADALIASGWVRLRRREPEAAADAFQRALTIDPQHCDALAGRGHAQLALGATADATESFSRALTVDADCVPALIGEELAALGTDSTWIEQLERTLGLPDAEAPAPAAAPADTVDRAVASVKRYVRERNDEASTMIGRAGGLRRVSMKGMFVQAVAGVTAATPPPRDSLARVLDRDPKNPDALLARAAGHAARDDLVAAARDLDAALAVNPHHVEAMLARAIVTMKVRRPADSLMDLDRALELAPLWPDLRVARGFAHLALERFDAAVSDLDQGLALAQPPSICGVAHVQLFRGRSLLRLGRTEEALAALTTAVELAPSSGAALAGRGRAHLSAGSRDAALDDARRATELDPANGEASRVRASALAAAAALVAGASQAGEERRARTRELVAAAPIDGGWKPDLLQAITDQIDATELPIAVFRCARPADVLRVVVLVITSTRLVWARRTPLGGVDGGQLALAEIDEVTAEPNGFALVSQGAVALRLRSFASGVDLTGCGASLGGAGDARELVRAMIAAQASTFGQYPVTGPSSLSTSCQC